MTAPQTEQTSDRKLIESLEGQAQRFWEIMEVSGLTDGHCKSYDPLTIEVLEDGTYNFLSYVFDYQDGGRSRTFDTLEDGQRFGDGGGTQGVGPMTERLQPPEREYWSYSRFFIDLTLVISTRISYNKNIFTWAGNTKTF